MATGATSKLGSLRSLAYRPVAPATAARRPQATISKSRSFANLSGKRELDRH